MPIIFMSEQFPGPIDAGAPDANPFLVQPGVPTTDQVLDAELALVLGAITNDSRAQQIAGVLRLAVKRGTTVVVAYPGTFQQELVIVQALAPCTVDDIGAAQGVEAAHPAFREYLSIFGRSAIEFHAIPDDAQVLGRLEAHSEHRPAAWSLPIGAGALYVVPFYLGGAAGFLDALLQAVRDHRSGVTGDAPEFLSELRLATEEELLRAIDDAATELDGLREQAARLSRFRLLVGPISGDAFEQLAIDALNVVFEGTDDRAEDREELRAEDFWIVTSDEERALAEAKGIGRHVRREDVNQVDNHRAEQERKVEELPGLLVVNIFRGDEHLERRTLPVSDDVIRHAVRQNVLILRGIDLYRLVSRKLAGEPAGEELVRALGSGGGWLRVEEDAAALETG